MQLIAHTPRTQLEGVRQAPRRGRGGNVCCPSALRLAPRPCLSLACAGPARPCRFYIVGYPVFTCRWFGWQTGHFRSRARTSGTHALHGSCSQLFHRPEAARLDIAGEGIHTGAPEGVFGLSAKVVLHTGQLSFLPIHLSHPSMGRQPSHLSSGFEAPHASPRVARASALWFQG